MSLLRLGCMDYSFPELFSVLLSGFEFPPLENLLIFFVSIRGKTTDL